VRIDLLRFSGLIMRLTTKGRFAVTAMIDLAMRESQGPVTLAGISQRQGISLSYLEQLFGKLRRNDLVESTRGPGGGYTLARSARDISVSEIIVAVDEPLDATQCEGKRNCHEDGPCMTHDLWSRLTDKMVEFLNSVTLASLVDQQRDRDPRKQPREISVLREHRAALEFPTSTLQTISLDNGRITTLQGTEP
jgi:Rrf2 family transcriptional regulator, iron-sulfur cluster assembly transcription factor